MKCNNVAGFAIYCVTNDKRQILFKYTPENIIVHSKDLELDMNLDIFIDGQYYKSLETTSIKRGNDYSFGYLNDEVLNISLLPDNKYNVIIDEKFFIFKELNLYFQIVKIISNLYNNVSIELSNRYKFECFLKNKNIYSTTDESVNMVSFQDVEERR